MKAKNQHDMQQEDVHDEDVENHDCQVCGEEMEFWNTEKTRALGTEQSLGEDEEIYACWSVKDCENAAFFFCEKCVTIEVVHKKCGTPMQLAGHHGYARDGTEHYRDAKTGLRSQLQKPGSFDHNKPRFQMYDLGQTKLRTNEWFPSGFSGTEKHFWTCPECSVDLSFSVNNR